MIHYILFCVLWSKPQVQLVEAPVSEYATATISQKFGDFQFDADVVEEQMNSVKITHLATGFSSQTNTSSGYQQRSLSLKLTIGETEASLDCEMRQKSRN